MIDSSPSQYGTCRGASEPSARTCARPSRRTGNNSKSSSVSGTMFRSAGRHPGDSTDRLVDGCADDIRNPRTTRFAPKRVKESSFDFPAEQSAPAGARKTEPTPVNEFGRENEGVTDCKTNSYRIDFGTRRRRKFSSLTVPILENKACRCVLHGTSCAAAKR